MSDGLSQYLSTRRSIPPVQMSEPAPDAVMIKSMLTIAARVPDHGKLAPWRFILYERTSRAELIAGLVRIAESHPDEREARLRAEKTKGLADAPLIIGVVSAPIADHPKIPLWEQQLSAGAVCLNLIHAAAAYGFAAQWLTGWFAYDPAARRWMGLVEGQAFAGLIHVGTPRASPVERDRPDVDVLTRVWSPGADEAL
jgi:nitroreductase